jgi:hypothetical protein
VLAVRLIEELVPGIKPQLCGILDGLAIPFDDPTATPIELPPDFGPQVVHCRIVDPDVEVFRLGDDMLLLIDSETLSKEDREIIGRIVELVAALRPLAGGVDPSALPTGDRAENLGTVDRLAASPTADTLLDQLAAELAARSWVRTVVVAQPTEEDTLAVHTQTPTAGLASTPSGEPMLVDPLVDAAVADLTAQTCMLGASTTESPVRRWARTYGATTLRVQPLSDGPIVHSVVVCGLDGQPPEASRLFDTLGGLAGSLLTSHGEAALTVADRDRDLLIHHPKIDCPFRRLATRLGTAIEFPHLGLLEPRVILGYAQIEGVDAERAVTAAQAVEGVIEVELLTDDGDPLVMLQAIDTQLRGAIRKLSPYIVSVEMSAAGATVRYQLPPSLSQRQLIARITAVLGPCDLRAIGPSTDRPRLPWERLLRDWLTDQQLEMLSAAYHAGYYGEDRPLTGTEIAEMMGMSQPTFSTHLRAAQEHLLAAVFEESEAPLASVLGKK